jgi:hypothetical protein
MNWLSCIFGRFRGLSAAALLGSSMPVLAQNDDATPAGDNVRVISTASTECTLGNRSVHEITPQVAFNDFDGRGQTVGALIYSYSQCIGSARHRWFVNAAASHVDESGFSANSVLLGGGVELRPLRDAPHLAIFPAVRIGREDYRPGPAATVVSASLTLSNVHPLSYQTRRIGGEDVKIAASQLEWAVRTEYASRDFSGPAVPTRDPDAVTHFASVGLDNAAGRSNWRWKVALAYHTLPGPLDGFASLGLSFRKVDSAYVNYDWNFAVSGQVGDGGFRGVIASVSRRFGR